MSKTITPVALLFALTLALCLGSLSDVLAVELTYATYLGGGQTETQGKVGVGTDRAYVSGRTWSGDFPGRGGDPTLSPALAFTVSFDLSGDYQWTRFLTGSYSGDIDGDSDLVVNDMAVNARGVYVVGFTGDDFATTDGSLAIGERDVALVKLDLAGNLLYATRFGGTRNDYAFGLAVDENGIAYVTGHTVSTDFPDGVGGTLSLTGGSDVIVMRVESLPGAPYEVPAVTAVSLNGDKNDSGRAVAVHDGQVYVCGFTASTDFSTANARFSAPGGRDDGFLARLSTDLEVDYVTYIGGSRDDEANAIAVDASGVHVVGTTGSGDFPESDSPVASFQGTKARGDDVFVLRFDLDGTAVTYSTFLGGAGTDEGDAVAINSSGELVLAGSTSSRDFPISTGAFDPSYNGQSDVVVTVLDLTAANSSEQLVYSSYFGGAAAEDRASLALGGDGAFHIAGKTSSADFPTSPDAFDASYDGNDAFYLKLERSPAPVCGDGACDPGEDPCSCVDCAAPASETDCANGIDDDCDGAIDCADSDCPLVAAETDCTDGVDNDCDGLLDCDDSDCALVAACQGGDCVGNKEPCSQDSDCCSGNCGRGACKGGGGGGAVADGTFLRGDASGDGIVDVSDVLFSLGALFLGKAAPACRDAADANDDGTVDIADASFTLSYLFLGGPGLPAPFPGAGEDPTPDGLHCNH